TLIELLVVVLIIGILSAVALPQYEKAAGKARLTEAITALKAITDAQEVYFMANGEYTNDLSLLDVSINPAGKYFEYRCRGGDGTSLSAVRTCFADPKLADYPTLEFHLQQVGNDSFVGKHWCQVGNITSDKAKALCRTVGPVDTSMTSGKFFLIGG
ncbi:MAG: type IV pilin-like G/H family protein, partial [Elusimicrobiales bacterium]|nr:type IV pilin-like G/H family protein [Elusimicrobiales bacterium]